jgi:hypothetical protein
MPIRAPKGENLPHLPLDIKICSDASMREYALKYEISPPKAIYPTNNMLKKVFNNGTPLHA